MRVTKYKVIVSLIIIILLNINILKAEENKKDKEEVTDEIHYLYITKETKEIEQTLKQKYERKKIYKEQVICDDKVSNLNNLECLIVNLNSILQNHYEETGETLMVSFSWESSEDFKDEDMNEFNKLNYNNNAFYYINTISAGILNKVYSGNMDPYIYKIIFG